jgi:transcriptional regulator with XRE-family HTH domain
MAEKPRHERIHLLNDVAPTSGFAPRHITQKEFGQRLYRLMQERGWTQAELSRRSGLTRDSVSTYVRGLTYPTGKSVQALARAFNVPPETIMPNHAEHAIEQDEPAFEMKQSTIDPSKSWVRVNRLVSTDVAVRFAQMLNDNAAERD